MRLYFNYKTNLRQRRRRRRRVHRNKIILLHKVAKNAREARIINRTRAYSKSLRWYNRYLRRRPNDSRQSNILTCYSRKSETQRFRPIIGNNNTSYAIMTASVTPEMSESVLCTVFVPSRPGGPEQ